MSNKKFLGAVELFEPSAKIIRDNLVPFAVLLAIPTLFTTLDSIRGDGTEFGALGFIGTILTIAFLPPLTKLMLLTTKGKTVSLNEAFDGSYKFFWRILGLGILVGLIVIAGLILFIVPGLIMIRRYGLSIFYLMDEDMSITDAMKKSAEQTKPYSWKIYSVLAVIFAVAFLSVFGVVGLVVSTILSLIYSLAFPLRYHEIRKANKN